MPNVNDEHPPESWPVCAVMTGEYVAEALRSTESVSVSPESVKAVDLAGVSGESCHVKELCGGRE